MEKDKNECSPEELRKMYEDYIWHLVSLEGGTMADMMEREPYEEWLASLDRRADECLHDCRYCGSFTGNDVTGCEGAPTPCPAFRLDLTMAPEWVKDYAYLFKQGE